MNTSPVEIAISSDRNYLPYAEIAIGSLLHFITSPVRIYFLHEGLTEEDFVPLRKLPCRQQWSLIPVMIPPNAFENWPVMRWSRATYYRLVLSSLLPETEKIIYVDCDLVFLDDVTELWNFDLKGFAAAAAFHKAKKFHRERIGMSPNAPYLNAGVMIFDLAMLRKNHAEEDFIAIQKEKADVLKYPDQDILNLYFQNRIAWFSIRWNLVTSVYRNPPEESETTAEVIRDALANPGIAHFTGVHKPWKVFSTTHHPYASAFYLFVRKISSNRILRRNMLFKRLLGWTYLKAPKKKVPWTRAILKKIPL